MNFKLIFLALFPLITFADTRVELASGYFECVTAIEPFTRRNPMPWPTTVDIDYLDAAEKVLIVPKSHVTNTAQFGKYIIYTKDSAYEFKAPLITNLGPLGKLVVNNLKSLSKSSWAEKLVEPSIAIKATGIFNYTLPSGQHGQFSYQGASTFEQNNFDKQLLLVPYLGDSKVTPMDLILVEERELNSLDRDFLTEHLNIQFDRINNDATYKDLEPCLKFDNGILKEPLTGNDLSYTPLKEPIDFRKIFLVFRTL